MNAKPLPIAMIIDDGAPVNLAYYLHPEEKAEFLIPGLFTRKFAQVSQAYGVKGKFTVMPMPSALGRIDRSLHQVPDRHLKEFLAIVRKEILPWWDITPEILTHQQALRLPGLNPMHLYEDEWVARSKAADMVEYFALALKILKNVGLPANGFTSPWMTGITNELPYAQAIGLAQWRVHRRAFTWYFLHIYDKGRGRWPSVTWRNKNVTVVMVPATTTDPFWNTQKPLSRRSLRQIALRGVDTMLSSDGKTGRMRELFEQPAPIVMVTHWQALFSNGTHTGLWGYEELLKRIAKTFGPTVEWMRCSDLARLSVKLGKAGIGKR